MISRLAGAATSVLLVFAITASTDADDVTAPPVPLQIDREIVRYKIEGDDLADLRDALRTHALSSETGGSHGHTHSQIEISYQPLADEQGCRAHGLRVGLDITTTLPDWPTQQQAPDELRKRWQSMIDALIRHEDVHREHAMEAARDLRRSLAAIGTLPDCRALRREVDRNFLRVTMRCEFRDARYDKQTRNGLEQGTQL